MSPNQTQSLSQEFPLKRKLQLARLSHEELKRPRLATDSAQEDVSMSEDSDSEMESINFGLFDVDEMVEEAQQTRRETDEELQYISNRTDGTNNEAQERNNTDRLTSTIQNLCSRMDVMLSQVNRLTEDLKRQEERHLRTYTTNALVDVARRVSVPGQPAWLERWSDEWWGDSSDHDFQTWLQHFAAHVTDAQLEDASVPCQFWPLMPQLAKKMERRNYQSSDCTKDSFAELLTSEFFEDTRRIEECKDLFVFLFDETVEEVMASVMEAEKRWLEVMRGTVTDFSFLGDFIDE